MKTKTKLQELKEEIEEIREKLTRLGPMHPGSISLQYQVCGRPGCRCQHPTDPKNTDRTESYPTFIAERKSAALSVRRVRQR
jgi:hypothetical protein